MSGFDAGQVVEPLAFDLAPYVAAAGTIPEPSEADLRAFQRGFRQATGAAEGDDMQAVLAGLSEDKAEALSGQLLTLVAVLCHDTPNGEQLAALPLRVQKAFFGWLFGELGLGNPT